jgi:hypothetical protein
VEPLISCCLAVDRLWVFLGQDLDYCDHRGVEIRLAVCRTCCGELEFAEKVRCVLATGRADELSSGLRSRLGRFVDHLAEAIYDGRP